MNRHHFEITRITDGLAFGHGPISGEDEPETLIQTDQAIHNSAEILVQVDKDNDGNVIEDDGCGDGRETKLTFRSQKKFKRSLNRAKVFGGAVAMTVASLIGTGQARGPLNETFNDAIGLLQDKKIEFGGHTDEQAEGENCGCGAIDKAPEAIVAALKYEKPIRAVIASLGADTAEIDTVYSNFRSYMGNMPGHGPYSGRQVMDNIIKAGKVVKQLGGRHRERRIILNTVRGHTVNQALIRNRTSGKAQAFAVDIWRLEDIANGVFTDEPQKQSQAYLSELVYTLAVSAVLTKGDLPVDMIRDMPLPATT